MNIKALTSLLFYINNSNIFSLSSVLANFNSLNLVTNGRLTIVSTTIQAENLCVLGNVNVTQKLSATSGDAVLYLFSGSLGRSSIAVNSGTGTMTINASQNTTPQVLLIKLAHQYQMLLLIKMVLHHSELMLFHQGLLYLQGLYRVRLL